VLDDQLWVAGVHDRIRRWSTVQFLRDIRPDEVIKDERVPLVLRTLRTPTFVTIDSQFWNRRRCDRWYCIVYFDLRADQQGEIPTLLRRLLRLPEFQTRAARMGKVARVSRDHVTWWQLGDDTLHMTQWSAPVRRRGHR
jgi:hypothetical protein